MIWWKEWRETRYGFLTALFFITSLFWSIPHRVIRSYGSLWPGLFLAFFTIAVAIVLGSSAVAPEIGTGTATFLVSKPAARLRLFLVKFFVRAAETTLMFILPVLCLIRWDDLQMWMWVPPYLFEKYILFGLLLVLLSYTATFLFSVIFANQLFCALGGIALFVTYFALRGFPIIGMLARTESVDSEILLVGALIAGIFTGSVLLFLRKEF